MPIESHRDVYLGVVIHFSTLSLPGWATTCYFIGGGVGHNTDVGIIQWQGEEDFGITQTQLILWFAGGCWRAATDR
jgi:hypothetical protein